MSILDHIKSANFDAIRSREYQLLEHVNRMIVDPSGDPEKYLTFWMAAHENPEFGLTMFEMFKNMCETALGHSKWNDIMKVFAYPTMCGAVSSQNIEILEHLLSHVDPETIMAENEQEFGLEYNDVYDWYVGKNLSL
jgi:hypothetical protein